MYASNSTKPEIIQMGIELNAFKARTARDIEKQSCKDTEMYLRGKLTGAEDCIQYFIKKAAQRQKEKTSWNYPAEEAVNLLKDHKKYNAALEVAERFLSPQHRVRFRLLEKLGDMQKLVAAYKEINDPIGYALTVAKLTKAKK